MAEDARELRRIINALVKEVDIKNCQLEDAEQSCNQLSRDIKEAMDLVIEYQQQLRIKDQMLEEMGNSCKKLSSDLNKAMDKVDELQQQIHAKNQMLEQVENECVKLCRLVDEKDELNKYYVQEMTTFKSTYAQSLCLFEENKRLRDQEKELEKKVQDIEKHEEQINRQKNFLTLAKEKLKCDLESMQEKTSELQEKTSELEYWQQEYKVLLAMQRQSNDDLQKARKTILDGFRDILSDNRGKRRTLGIKRMGELDMGPFRDACAARFPPEEVDIKAAELCTFWQQQMEKPEWHPFRLARNARNLQEEIDEYDEKLRNLKNEWGEKLYDAVTRALLDLNEYNGSGRYPVPEFWNFKEERRASLNETIVYILNQLKIFKNKVYKRRIG